jgi:hypothetical protein
MNEALKDMLTQDAIIVKQDMEVSNIVLGIDAANRYSLFDSNGQSLGIAAEESSGAGGWLIRDVRIRVPSRPSRQPHLGL